MAFEIFILCLWFGFLVAQQQLLTAAIRRNVLTPFGARKISHLTVGLWVVPLAAYVRNWYLAAIPISMILAANLHANSKRGNLGRLQKQLFPLFSFLLPEVLILYFWQQGRSPLVVLAVLAMTVGDTAAAYVGIHFGKHRFSWTGKTIEGGIANFTATLLVLGAVGHASYHLPFGLFPLPAALVAVLEAVTPGEWDNPLTIVVLLALFGYLLR